MPDESPWPEIEQQLLWILHVLTLVAAVNVLSKNEYNWSFEWHFRSLMAPTFCSMTYCAMSIDQINHYNHHYNNNNDDSHAH